MMLTMETTVYMTGKEVLPEERGLRQAQPDNRLVVTAPARKIDLPSGGDVEVAEWDPQFSYFRAPVSNVLPSATLGLRQVYERITGGVYAAVTARLRELQDPQQRRGFKARSFPYVTFSGVFSKRCDSGLLQHSGLLALDFDHVEELSELKELLLNDGQLRTELLFTSPSGQGLKWIVQCEPERWSRSEYFRAVSSYIEHTYGIRPDASGRDVSRACFLVNDPDCFLNPDYGIPKRESAQEPIFNY